jgi:HD-like signal output (HDOD) protein
MPDSVLLLQVLLSGTAVNLRSVAEVIRGDVGLTIQLLRLAASEQAIEQAGPDAIEATISGNVVHIGVHKLLSLVTEMELLSPDSRGRSALRDCELFWSHAKLTALMAEELAYKSMYPDAEEAYVAGLLFHIGELPMLLGWESQFADAAPREVAALLAQEWQLPPVLQSIFHNDEPAPNSLLDLVRTADDQARRIQGLVARYARSAF